MKHKFIGEPISVGTSLWEITVRLIPANEIETKAIQNMEIDKATDTERSLVNDYLLFSILGWSTLSIHSQNGAIFKLKATNS